MILQVHKPAFPLNHFVENLVYYHGGTALHNRDRFLPDGNTEIILDLTENPQYIYDNETLQEIQVCRRAWASGVRTKPITIPSGKGSRMLIVAFKKGQAFPFYPFPMSELTDTVAETEIIFGRKFSAVREQLLAARSLEQMFRLVERFLLQQAGSALEPDTPARCIRYAVASMVHDPTARRLYQLSQEIGYSQKHFIELFRGQVGVSPKQYLRIMRFQRAIETIEKNGSVRWSTIALESGYYDQAHFIHDFKLFSGFTPNEYRKKKTASLNYVPMD